MAMDPGQGPRGTLKEIVIIMQKLLVTLLLGSTIATGASAQAWPSKPVTLLVPFPAGGSTDMIARIIAPKLQEKFGSSFVVDNKGGAGGTIGAAIAKRAAPDGYTIFVSSLGPLVIGPHLMKNTGYDALKDFDYITVAVQAPNILTVPANSPHKSVADVIAFHKANPAKMTFASAGNGSSDHLTAELFWQQTGTKGVHVPYKGGAPAMTDLLGGRTPITFERRRCADQIPAFFLFFASHSSTSATVRSSSSECMPFCAAIVCTSKSTRSM